MFWVIVAFIVLALVLCTLRNIYVNEDSLYELKWVKMKRPIWAWLLLTLGCLIPIINLVELVFLLIFLIAEVVNDDNYQLRGPVGKFIAWLTKEV